MAGEVFTFSDRRGGVSTGRFAEANLSTSVGDNPACVKENRGRLLEALGLTGHRLVTTKQGHGSNVVTVSASDNGTVAELPALPVHADGMVTTARGVALLVGVADCVPVVLLDDGVVGVLHVGWRGLLDGIVEKGMEAMQRAGGEAGPIRAVLGPAIGPCHYPVGEDVRIPLVDRYAAAAAVTSTGAPTVDLPGATAEALASLGVEEVVRNSTCTYESELHFSARRDGRTGCQGGLVALL